MSGLSEDAARALAKKLNWEPPGHLDLPGFIPEDAWEHWRAFEVLAAQAISWRKVDQPAWRAAHASEWSPDVEAKSDGQHLLLVQHSWHGFPDPPEWALHVMDHGRGDTRCLGCFHYWPDTWSEGE